MMRKSVTGFILLIQAAIGMAADVEITYSKEPGDVFQASKRIVCAAGFKTPPTIDGKLDDAQWQATPLQTDFTLIGSNAATKEKNTLKTKKLKEEKGVVKETKEEKKEEPTK